MVVLLCQKLGEKTKKAHTMYTPEGIKALPTWEAAKETYKIWYHPCSLSQDQDAEGGLKTQRSQSFLSWTTIMYVS